MKIAVLSDIHSNVYALEAVITDAKKRGSDLMLNLGDILYGPIAPRATYDLLRANDFVTIRGNQDRQIYEAATTKTESNPTMEFILEDLGDEAINWMKSLPFDKQLTQDIYMCHATPTDDLIYLLEDVESGTAKLRTDAEILGLLNGQSSELILCGHTHTARCVYTSTNQLIVNPGSVGLPAYSDEEPTRHSMESFSPHATYAIVEKSNMGWIVQHVKVPYDVKKAMEKAHQVGRTDWGHFLSTGRRLQ